MSPLSIIILSSIIAFQPERQSADTASAKVDTIYSLAFRASKGDKDAQNLFRIRKRREYSDDEKRNEMLSRFKAMQAEGPGLRSGTAPVQEIPMQESFTPTGALTYSIPIATAAGCKFVPQISLVYNSQAGNGVAGFGWEIAGLSAVSIRNKNIYYDGITAAPLYPNVENAMWSLDGEPLVQNEDIASFPGFQYQTAKGRVMVKKIESDNQISSFQARFPDGRILDYGLGMSPYQKRVFCPVTNMRDIFLNEIFISYNSSSFNCQVVDEIKYGGTTEQTCPARIVFTYESARSDALDRYRSGIIIRQHHLLKSITSYDGNEEICTYTLTHTLKDSVYLLTRIDCSRGNSQLQPLLFDYGTTGSYEDAGIALADTTSLGAGYDNSGDQYYNYVRGKFLPGKSDDGVLSYERNDFYFGIPPHTIPTSYYCGYSPTSNIYVSPKLDTLVSCTDTLKAGNWFQAVAAADVDGDGADEIVKVNVGNCRSGYTDLLITIRRYDPSTLVPSTVIYPVTIKGSMPGSGDLYYPFQRAYYFGDFLGNGKTQLLVFCYSKNMYGLSQTNTSALISLDNGVSVLSDEVITGCNYVNAKSVFVADIDGDGKVELCDFFTTSGDNGYANIYRSDNAGHFSQQETITGISSAILKDSEQPPFFLDHNGDGYLDILVPPKKSTNSENNGDTWKLYHGTGSTFRSSELHICKRMIYATTSFHWQTGTDYRFYDDHYFFTDVTNDGIADMVRVRLDQIVVFKGTPGGFESTPMPVTAALERTERGLVPQNVVRYDGKASVICVDGTAVKLFQGINTSEERRRLFCSQDSFGRQRQYDYSNMASRGGAYSDDPSFVFSPYDGYAQFCAPLPLIERGRLFGNSDPDAPVLADKRWTYTGAVLHREGLGFRGFEKVGCSEPIADRYSLTSFYTRIFGVPKEVLVSRDSVRTDTLSVSSNYWEVLNTTYGKERPRLYFSNSYNRLSGLRVLQSYEYDSYDNPTWTITSRRTNLGDVKTDTVRVGYSNNFTSSTGYYVLGAAHVENSYLGGWRKHTARALDSYYRLESIRDCAWRTNHIDSLRTLTDTRFEYDQNGNVSRKRVSTHGTGDYLESTYTYDSAGRHLISETDPLGLTTTYSNYNVFGKPASATDPKGRTTSYTYDYWGTLVRTDNPDGSWTSQSTSWCSGGEPGLYKVESQDAAGAMTCSFYDALGREILSANKRFDGQWQCRRKEYNSKGQIARVSLPYRRQAPADTATALLWNNYLYDAYGRDTCFLEASGRRSSTIYNQSVTTTVRDSIVSTSTVDALGRTVLVHDAGGDIVYSYRPDGNPSSVSAHGGVVTSFGYNSFGERNYILDPSLGVQTDSTTWNADGSRVTTSTNVYGTSVGSYDRYGRLLTVQKIGQDTVTYAYDAYNLLTGLSSTNGTAISYSYDGYDRLASSTEHHGTDSLRTAYTYNASGQLASKTYTSNYLFAPVTENYSYFNGHNTATTALLPVSYSPGVFTSKTVKQLLAENEFGQPTSVQVSIDTRSYAYDQYGLPTSRSVGPGMTETYQYNPVTRNLAQRAIHDEWLSGQAVLQDSFTYDALGRLSGVSTSPTAPVSVAGSTTYDSYSNATQIAQAASMQYASPQHPYTLTSYTAADSTFQRNLTCSYNVDGKPSSIENARYDATISYGCNGERASMLVHDKNTDRTVANRQYFGGCMEVYQYANWYYTRLYLGGGYYDSPVYADITEDPMEVLLYTVWRDNLGSVRDECLVDEEAYSDWEPTSYDAWGRGRDYYDDVVLQPFGWLAFYRGFGGHEFLPWFGLYNANARLYDPLLGRFLTPDPYLQAPGFSVNFNRFAYCLNNPLKYSDQSGALFGIDDVILFSAAIGAFSGAAMASNANAHGFTEWTSYIVSGACIGVISSGLGMAAGSAMASMTHLGGFIGGALSGMVGGGIAGGFSGFFNSALSGYNTDEALRFGLVSAGIGALTGSLISGIGGGVRSRMHNGSFWNGVGETFDYVYDPTTYNGNNDPVEYSQDAVQAFSDKNFGKQPEWIRLIADGSVPGDYSIGADGRVYNTSGQAVYGACRRLTPTSFGTYVFQSACSSKYQLYLTLGHEYMHAYFLNAGILGDDKHHEIIHDWQYKQSLEWNFNTGDAYNHYIEYHDPLFIGESHYLGADRVFNIINRWHLL